MLQSLALAALVTIAPAAAAQDAVSAAQVATLKAALEKPDRGLTIESVEVSEAPGLFAVQFANGPVVYATGDGKHFVVGDLHRVEGGQFVNLTERRRDVERLARMDAVKTEEMIVFSPEGETRTHISVFTDVTCFYCQKLHLEVPELNKRGVEVRYLAYPRAGLKSDGYNKLATAWCADDPQTTLTKLKAKESVKEKICEPNPIAGQFELGQAVGVSGTPAIVTEDGKLIPGYRPAADLVGVLGLD